MSMRVYKIGRKIGIGEMEVGVVVLGLIEATWKFTVKAIGKFDTLPHRVERKFPKHSQFFARKRGEEQAVQTSLVFKNAIKDSI